MSSLSNDIIKLKSIILETAIQGKLVPQYSSEEDAGRLLDKLNVHNTASSTNINSIKLPFNIPSSWRWVTLGEVGETNIGLTYSPSEISKNGTPVLRSGNIKNNSLILDDLVRVDKEINEKLIVREGDILICARNGSKHLVGKSVQIKAIKEKMSFGAFMAIYRSICNDYIVYFINSSYFKKLISDVNTTTINQLTQANLKGTMIPLPPLQEQKRIVTKIQSLFVLCEQLGLLGVSLEEKIKLLKSAILQEAIMGKLVPQNSKDENAEDLLQKIQSEKEKLVKEGKLKKEKPLPVINDNEIPFEVPDNWKWVRMGDVVVVKSSKRIYESDYISQGVPFFRSKEIGELAKGLQIRTNLYISEEKFKNIKEKYGIPNKGDLLLTSVGTLGNTWIVDDRKFYYKDGNITQLVNHNNIDIRYIDYFIKSNLFMRQVLGSVSGTAYSALTIIKINKLAFPLPPLKEQKRIVERIETLFSTLDTLLHILEFSKNNLTNNLAKEGQA